MVGLRDQLICQENDVNLISHRYHQAQLNRANPVDLGDLNGGRCKVKLFTEHRTLAFTGILIRRGQERSRASEPRRRA
jgi:hypothetical protein